MILWCNFFQEFSVKIIWGNWGHPKGFDMLLIFDFSLEFFKLFSLILKDISFVSLLAWEERVVKVNPIFWWIEVPSVNFKWSFLNGFDHELHNMLGIFMTQFLLLKDVTPFFVPGQLAIKFRIHSFSK